MESFRHSPNQSPGGFEDEVKAKKRGSKGSVALDRAYNRPGAQERSLEYARSQQRRGV